MGKSVLNEKYGAYPEYKDSGVEWLREIPKHWECKRIKETANLINGYPFDSKKFEAGKGVPLVRIRDIRASKTEVGFIGVVPPESLINNGDILIGMDGDFNVSLWSGGEAALNQRVACIRASNYYLQKFIFYVLPFNMKKVNDLTYFTTVKHLSSIDILKTVYAFPSGEELNKIVDFLDHETAKIDTLIEKQQQLIALLKEKRQAVISHAVTKGLNPNAPMKNSGVEWLGDVPAHWDVAKVKYFASIQGGYAFSSESFQEEGVQLLRIGNVYLNRLALERQPSFVDESFLETHKDFSVKRGDILMSLTGTLGKTDYGFAVHVDEDGPFMLNQRVAKITPRKSKIAPEYLIYAIRSESYLKQLYSLPSGTKQANLSNDDVTNIPIVVPSTIEEQLLVARYISDNLEKYNKVIGQSEAAIKLMQERRTALISAAVTGKIDVRNWSAA